MQRYLLATHNLDKVVEIEAIFREALGDDIEFVPGIDPGEVIEDGDTIEENAMIKANAWLDINSDCIVLADDTGLFVDALDGAPGIFAARFAGDEATYSDNCAKLLNELDGIEQEKRTAKFSTAAVAVRAGDISLVSVGNVDGIITTENRGTDGFGYDPVFMPTDHDNDKTFAELGVKVKNMISHRARAFRALAMGIKDAQW